MNNLMEWWIEHITFMGFNFIMWVMDGVDDFVGSAAAMGLLVLLIPVVLPLLAIGMLSTIIPMALCVLWLPIALVVGVVKRIRA